MIEPQYQAKHYYKGRLKPVRLIVIHDMEVRESATTAETVARMFATTDRDASAHYCIDQDSVVQGVEVMDTAWAAPGANADGIQLEHAGYARQSRAEWLNDLGTLRQSARLSAQLAARFNIPLRRLSTLQVKDGTSKGFVGHNDVSNAFRLSDHTDPGPNFPWDTYFAMCGGPGKPTPPDALPLWYRRVLRQGDHGLDVQAMQRRFGSRTLRADGAFGPATTAAVKRTQINHRLTADGIVGPQTAHVIG